MLRQRAWVGSSPNHRDPLCIGGQLRIAVLVHAPQAEPPGKAKALLPCFVSLFTLRGGIARSTRPE